MTRATGPDTRAVCGLCGRLNGEPQWRDDIIGEDGRPGYFCPYCIWSLEADRTALKRKTRCALELIRRFGWTRAQVFERLTLNFTEAERTFIEQAAGFLVDRPGPAIAARLLTTIRPMDDTGPVSFVTCVLIGVDEALKETTSIGSL